MKSIPLIAALLSLVAAAPAPVPHVSTQRMSEITRVLASDEFQGRAPGTPGEEKTIPYLIEQFKAAGLEPAGENGGWTQTVPMIHTKLAGACGSVRSAKAARRPRSDFPTTSISARFAWSIACAIANAPMVFVGYGVTAPERGWDDFKGVDLQGQDRRDPGQRSRLRGGRRRAGRRQVRRQDDDLSTAAGPTSTRRPRGAAPSAR